MFKCGHLITARTYVESLERASAAYHAAYTGWQEVATWDKVNYRRSKTMLLKAETSIHLKVVIFILNLHYIEFQRYCNTLNFHFRYLSHHPLHLQSHVSRISVCANDPFIWNALPGTLSY